MTIVIEGLAVLGVARTGGLTSPGSQFTLPVSTVLDFPSGGAAITFKAGDISFCCQLAEGAPTTPALVVPAGWSNGLNVTGVNSMGEGLRMSYLYKILTSGDLGATFTAMNGTGRNRCCVTTFAMSRAVQSMTIGSVVSEMEAAGNPSGVTVVAAGQVGNVFVLVNAHGQTDIVNTNFTWSPACIGSQHIVGYPDHPKGTDNPSNTTLHGFTYYPHGNAPASHACDIPAQGEFAALAGAYFKLT